MHDRRHDRQGDRPVTTARNTGARLGPIGSQDRLSRGSSIGDRPSQQTPEAEERACTRRVRAGIRASRRCNVSRGPRLGGCSIPGSDQSMFGSWRKGVPQSTRWVRPHCPRTPQRLRCPRRQCWSSDRGTCENHQQMGRTRWRIRRVLQLDFACASHSNFPSICNLHLRATCARVTLNERFTP